MKYIYIVVGFPFSYVKGCTYLNWYSSFHKKHKGARMTDISPKSQEKRLKSMISKPKNMGYFESLDDAKRAIAENGYHMHEGAYYTHLLIEEIPIGQIDAYDFEPKHWYKGYSTGNGWNDYEYRKCRRPRWAKGTFGFSN